MNIRSAILLPLLPLLLTTAAPAQGNRDSFQTPAVLVSEGGTSFQRVWIVDATKTSIRYRETEVATSLKEGRISQYQTIYLYEPPDYTTAIDLFQARRYAEAKELFAKVRATYEPVNTIENNPSTLAAFHEMECLRKMGDLEGLAAALAKFDKAPLTREYQLRQIELYLLWEAVRNGNWQQVESLVNERAKSRLPGNQHAQLAYCHGLALEATERQQEAVLAFHTAMVVDAAASHEISSQAALKLLTYLTAKPEVKRAIQVWGTPEENTSSYGYARLLEAGAIARLFEMSLGGGSPLPEPFKDLPQYQSKEEDAPGLGVAPPPTE